MIIPLGFISLNNNLDIIFIAIWDGAKIRETEEGYTLKKSDIMLRLGLLYGELMLKSGAEIYRVEDSSRRLLVKVGAEEVESIVTPTGIYLSLRVDGHLYTAVRRVIRGSYDLNLVCELNTLSRTLATQTDADSTFATVISLANNPPPYSRRLQGLAATVAGGGFTYLFGGTILDVLAGAMGAMLVWLTCLYLAQLYTNRFVIDFCGGAIAALSAGLLSLVLPVNMDPAVIGAIMTLVPGVLLTNAVRDALTGDLLSGAARMVEALFVSVAIAGGVGAALSIWLSIRGLV